MINFKISLLFFATILSPLWFGLLYGVILGRPSIEVIMLWACVAIALILITVWYADKYGEDDEKT